LLLCCWKQTLYRAQFESSEIWSLISDET
jgi:hypothetical protein